MAQTSMYQEAWSILKAKDVLVVHIKCSQDVSQVGREKLLLKFRKALSRRKEVDSEFQVAHPTAKLLVPVKDFEAMRFTFELVHYADATFLVEGNLSKL